MSELINLPLARVCRVIIMNLSTYQLCFVLQVPSSQLRYIVGCDLTEGPSNRQAEEVLTSNGYSIWTFPKCTSAVITEFPLRSKLCCLVGALRVYPALNKYFKVCVYAWMQYIYMYMQAGAHFAHPDLYFLAAM